MYINTIITESKKTVVLAGPLIIGQLLHMAMGFIDLVMIGRLGATELAAGGLAATLWSFIIVSCMGLLMAISAIVAQFKGAGQHLQIGVVFRQALWLSMIIGVAAYFVTERSAAVLGLFGIEPAAIELAIGYLSAVAWGMPAACIYFVGRFLSEGVAHTRPIMLIQFMALILNCLANYILIYGKWGAPALGVAGAGWATTIVLYVDALLIMVYLRLNSLYNSYQLFNRFTLPDWNEIAHILKISFPIALTLIMELSLFSTVALLMGRFGIAAVAAHQVAINYAALMYMVPLGLSMAATVRVGHAVGEGKVADARFRAWIGVLIAICFMLLSAIIMLIFPKFIVGIYTQDAEVSIIAVELLFMAALFQLSDGLQAMGAGNLRGLKDTTIPMVAVAISYWLIGFPVAWYVGIFLSFGPVGLWIGLIIGLTVAALLLNIRFYRISHIIHAE